MCRYIQESDLTAAASAEDVAIILAALETRNYKLRGLADRYVAGVWRMTAASFIGAIRAHLEAGCRIFDKPIQNPPPDTLFFHGNIGLDPDDDDEDLDVYVEIRLENQKVVILCDAHNHPRTQPRLPK